MVLYNNARWVIVKDCSTNGDLFFLEKCAFKVTMLWLSVYKLFNLNALKLF